MSNASAPKSVLFVCNMNQIRSPMAEYLTRHHFGKTVFALSAGLEYGSQDGFVNAVMREKGIDISGHEPETLKDLEDSYFDLVISLTDAADQECRRIFGNDAMEIENWSTENPSSTIGRREDVLRSYRKTCDDLEKRIIARFGAGD